MVDNQLQTTLSLVYDLLTVSGSTVFVIHFLIAETYDRDVLSGF